jgi:hypothetical protein
VLEESGTILVVEWFVVGTPQTEWHLLIAGWNEALVPKAAGTRMNCRPKHSEWGFSPWHRVPPNLPVPATGCRSVPAALQQFRR